MTEQHPKPRVDKDGRPLPEVACLDCGKTIDAAARTVDKDDDRPSPGDVAICFYCGHLMVFADDMSVREPTEGEVIEMAGDPDIVEGMRMRAVVQVEPGVWRFVCMDCGYAVSHIGIPPNRAVCAVCEFIRDFGNDMPEAEKRRLRERG
jgi:DNA-directed RNA polymerase subunit RPC12/RpoP